MNFQKMQLIVSAPNKKSWPETTLPEIVLAGRSNVGKSSLINTLSGNKRTAYVGNTPGKTRLLNFFDVDEEMVMVDVPGYGYANASQKMLLQFGQMMEDYFAERQNIKAVVILVDARRKPSEDDLAMIEFARYYSFPIILVVTKVDKCTRNELDKNLKVISQDTEIPKNRLILFSSETKQGRDELVSAINHYIQN